MDQNDQTASPAPQSPGVSSLMSRITNVFMAPGDLYDEVAVAPVQATSWAIPYVVGVLIAVFVVVMMFSTPTLFDQILAAQREAMQQQVAAGKMTAEQAEKAQAFASPGMMKAFGSLGAVVFMSAMMFLIPLVLFAVAKLAFKFPGKYPKLLETYGLASCIGAVGGLVTLLMMVGLDSLYAQPGPVFLIRDSYVPGNFVHGIIASLNVFTIWQAAVLGLGFGKVTGRGTGTGMAVTFGLWILWVLVASALGWGGR